MKKMGGLFLVIVLTVICSLILIGILAAGDECSKDDLNCQSLQLKTVQDTKNSYLRFQVDNVPQDPILEKIVKPKPKVVMDYYNYSVGGSSSSGGISSSNNHDKSVCGNGKKEKTEQCDDGNKISGDGCSNLCKLEIHGIEKDCQEFGFDYSISKWECNGIWTQSEMRIPGTLVSGTCEKAGWSAGASGADGIVIKAGSTVYYQIIGTEGIVYQEKPAASYITFCGFDTICGDGSIDTGEECDDGNTDDGDGCSSKCIQEYCGDGILNNNDEECDQADSNTDNACTPPYDGSCTYCDTACNEHTLTDGSCGDGIINGPEECDNGNDNGIACIPEYDASCEYCSESCEKIILHDGYCGDGELNAPYEECDEGNNNTDEECVPDAGSSCTYCDTECNSHELTDEQCYEDTDCDDQNLCTTDTCSDGTCEHSDITCDDGNWCNGAEICNSDLGCTQSTSPCTYYVDACTDVACDEENDICLETPITDCCIEDSDCASLNEVTCDGDNLVTKEGKCDNQKCVAVETSTQDCSKKSDTYMQCGSMDYVCSETEKACVPDQIVPDDSKCSSFCCGDVNMIGYCDKTTYLCSYIKDDCNDYDTRLCDGSKIISEDYSCSSGACIVSDSNEVDCDNGLFCDGEETCENANCIPGSAVTCAGDECNEAACDEEQDSCVNIPKAQGTLCADSRNCEESGCSDPWDDFFYYYPKDGHDTCDGQGNCKAYSCELKEKECDKECGAECDSDGDCACQPSGCIDADQDGLEDDYASYPDFGACNEDCSCNDKTTSGEPCEPDITIDDTVNCNPCAGVDCTGLDDECNQGVCNPDTGACEQVPANDGTTCDDGLFCTSGDICGNGICQGDLKDCADGNICTADSCNEDLDKCEFENIEGCCLTADDCDDENACTTDLCIASSCEHVGVVCDDGIDCTIDSCDAKAGCEYSPDNTICDDGNICTDDICDAGIGCDTIYNSEPCDDGNLCSENDICIDGECVGSEKDCNSFGDDCNDGVCNPFTGNCEREPLPNHTPCEDGKYCTIEDVCTNGICEGINRDCSDGNECTDDACNEDTDSCENLNLPQGTLCGSARDCEESGCSDPWDDYFYYYTADGHDSCDGRGNCEVYECGIEDKECDTDCGAQCEVDADCDNVELCTGTRKTYTVKDCTDCECKGRFGTWQCIEGSCDAQCDEESDCVCQPSGCIDADADGLKDDYASYPEFGSCGSSGDESCLCQTGTGDSQPCQPTITIDDSRCDPCAGVDCSNLDDGCNVGVCEAGICLAQPLDDGTSCNDDNLCTENDICIAGVCSGSLLDCSSYGDQCNGGMCDSITGTCIEEPLPNNAPCDDESACTENDVCTDGTCAGSTIDCSDDNICTDDMCDPVDGCYYIDNTAPCNDGLFCTENDICGDGECTGEEKICNDDVSCTIDSCNEEKDSCEYTASDSYCDNGLWCDGLEFCDVNNGCQSGPEVECSDGVDCTIDSCNEDTDSCENTPDNSYCVDDLYCNGQEYCDVELGCQREPIDCSYYNRPCYYGVCSESLKDCIGLPKLDGTSCVNECGDEGVCYNGWCVPEPDCPDCAQVQSCYP